MGTKGTKSHMVTRPATGVSRLVQPFGGTPGNDGVFEADTYELGIHIPAELRDGFGSNYDPAWYTKSTINPGDTIVIANMAWGKLEIFGVKGTADKPIHIVTEDDAIVTFSKGLYLNDCEYVFVNGIPAGKQPPKRYPTAGEAAQFRIQFQGVWNARYAALQVYGRSRHVHIQGIKANVIQYGIQMKTDPTCDIRYNNNGWVMDNITLKHFWFEDVNQDVIYWGNSSNMLKTDDSTNGRDITCSTVLIDGDPDYLPMKLGNTEVAYGVIKRAGRQGLVIGGCWYGVHAFHDMYIRNMGYELNLSQGEGIGSGGMNRNIFIYNNDIKNTFNYSIADFGNQTWIYDNIMDEAGYLDSTQAIETVEAGFLNPGDDLDAIVAANPTLYERDGDNLKVIYAGGVYNISSTTKIYYPTTSSKVSYIFNNLFGSNSRSDGYELAFEDYGPPENWLTTSVVYGNTLLDGTTPIDIVRFTYLSNPHPQYSTTYGDIPKFN